ASDGGPSIGEPSAAQVVYTRPPPQASSSGTSASQRSRCPICADSAHRNVQSAGTSRVSPVAGSRSRPPSAVGTSTSLLKLPGGSAVSGVASAPSGSVHVVLPSSAKPSRVRSRSEYSFGPWSLRCCTPVAEQRTPAFKKSYGQL